MTRIYQANISQPELTLTEEAANHVAKVLRMRVGDSLTLFDGQNHEYEATIQDIQKKQVLLSVSEARVVNRESALNIELAQVMSKGDRMEIVVQKMTELGANSMVPLTSERCVVKLDASRMEKKRAQWKDISIASCEQCGRNQLPDIKPLDDFKTYIKKPFAGVSLILHTEGAKDFRLQDVAKDALNNNLPIRVLIGPEGGFSDAEYQEALLSGFKPIHLGERVLRTETATIVALSLLQFF